MAAPDRLQNIAHLRLAARARLPRPVFYYLDGGANDERSLCRNASAFADYELPDVLVDVSRVRTATTLLLAGVADVARLERRHVRTLADRAEARYASHVCIEGRR